MQHKVRTSRPATALVSFSPQAERFNLITIGEWLYGVFAVGCFGGIIDIFDRNSQFLIVSAKISIPSRV
ncbi:MAG: hypothetical protein P4L40_24290 [Terracidiphilus sp.]|nr:hypothetical protein [Terracidiphilus sp.]